MSSTASWQRKESEMSWINFQNLIENLDVNPEHWQNAIKANPNTPEAALKVAIMKIFETKDMQSLDDLCSCVVSIVNQAVEHTHAPDPLRSGGLCICGKPINHQGVCAPEPAGR
jgi:hypothetical protein